MVERNCLNGGVCGDGDFESALRHSIRSPDDFERIERAATVINDAIAEEKVSDLFRGEGRD